MVDIQTVSIAIASASVVAGIVYYAFQVRHQTRLREMDLILRLDAKWMDNIEQCWQVIRKTEFKNFDDYEDKCPLEVAQVAGFFESLGLLLRRGFVDIDIVSGLFIMGSYWQKLKLWVEGKRERANNPESYVYFEYLYNEWKKREQKLHQSKD
jgi:hypothetical protein